MISIESNKLKTAVKILRFLVGLSTFVLLLWFIPKSAGADIISALFGYISFPLVIFFAPAVIIGLYFIITTKLRLRLDILLLLLLVFLIFNLKSVTSPPTTQDISGDTRVEITVLREDKTPVANLEVDLGERPGPPPVGGRQLTNSKGIATFFVKSGTYKIYFNTLNFPKDLIQPIDPLQIKVEEGKINTKTIILNYK